MMRSTLASILPGSRRLASILLVVTLAACGSKAAPTIPTPATPPPTEAAVAAKMLVNVDDEGVGLSGFDPMGYRSDHAAVPGVGEHAASHGGATYWFVSSEHEAAFAADPAKFAPQYGGYCAYAMSQGRLSPIQPEQFEVVDGQLLLFTNAEFKNLFDADPEGIKAKADANWPQMVEQHGK